MPRAPVTLDRVEGVRRPWTIGDVAAISIVEVVGLLAACVGAVMAYFGLPPDGLDYANSTEARLLGVLGAVVCAVGLPAGFWEASRRRRSRGAAFVATIVGVAVLCISAAWAFQLDWF